MKWALVLVSAWFLSFSSHSTSVAQQSAVVGVWSHTSYTSTGAVFASFWLRFDPDGQMQQRFITTAGTVDYFGYYRFDATQNVVQYQLNDYHPKVIAPTMQLGALYEMPVQFASQNTMLVMDAGGPMEYHRQQ